MAKSRSHLYSQNRERKAPKNRESKQNDSMIVVARREAKFESFSQT